jgi:thioredoxin-related protein
MFHRNVADDYSNSWPGRIAPLERIYVSEYRANQFELKAPIQIVPTFVLIEDGKELLRLTGYFGRQNFFQIMTSVLRGYR